MNIGIDIVENKRLKHKKKGFIDYVLTKKEQDEFNKKGYLYLCGRFAVKEAIMKALPNTKEYNFLDFEILTKDDGSPYVVKNDNIKISISHEKNYTVATALLLSKKQK